MFAIKSLTKQPFRRSGVSFSPDFWTLIESPTEAQLNEPNLKVIEVSGPEDPALDGAVNELNPEVAPEPSTSTPILVRISIDGNGNAHIAAPDNVEVTFSFVDDLPDGEPFIKLTDFVPDEWVIDSEPQDNNEQSGHFEGLTGLGDELKAALVAAGIPDVATMRSATDEALLAVSGIGAKKLADLRAQLAALPV